ncbi:MAG: GcrA family cell cycle regulator [Minwuia sp.]|nr:GcrA family cell cycle regulator [Minwuia sp.]
MRPTWTNGQRARLVALAADPGNNASDIAAALRDEFNRSFTRNAVLGFANRQGIKVGALRQTPAQTRAEKRAARAHADAARPRRERARVPSTKVMPRRRPADVKAGQPWPDDTVHVPGLAAPPHGQQCAWPIGDPGAPGFGFCGRNVAARQAAGREGAVPLKGLGGRMARTYCAAHARRSIRRAGEAADPAGADAQVSA